MKERILDFIFPPSCAVCESEGTWVCQTCISSFSYSENARCPFCTHASFRGFLCRRCREKHALSQIVAAFSYESGQVRRVIHSIKFGGVHASIPVLSRLMFSAWQKYGDGISRSIIPLPLHKKRLSERGFNQAEEFARNVSQLSGMRYVPDALVRTRSTKAQAELSADQRRENIRDAFECTRQNSISENDILLIDDVFTTGATLNEASRALKRAGAGDICALTFAHG